MDKTINKSKLKPCAYTKREEFLNYISHFAGIVISIIGAVFLFYYANIYEKTNTIWTLAIYVFTAILLFTCSTVYHRVKSEKALLIMRKMDHISISILTAGTATPLAIECIPGTIGIVFISVMWAIAIVETILNIIDVDKYSKISLIGYIVMGWLIIFLCKPLIENAGWISFWFLLGGGAAYTLGTIPYLINKEFSHFVWHIFVLAGAVLHYFAILYGVIF